MISAINLEMKKSNNNIILPQLKSVNDQVKSNIFSSSSLAIKLLLTVSTSALSKNVQASTGSTGVDAMGLFELCSDDNNKVFNAQVAGSFIVAD